jgi:IS30 family transposase
MSYNAPDEARHTLTLDKGKEFAAHRSLSGVFLSPLWLDFT